ncbi:MAG: cation diffusion facilitator family transporter [Rickettsiales bacterium]|nr:MAG: cation diffusion facilitator family transporter [Rickettsiales bacterium]
MSIFNLKDDDLIRSASYVSVTVATIILSVKAYGLASTDSQTLLASLVDSLLDMTSSIINLIAIRFALLPPDKNHRFGHEKFQDLAIFSQSIFFFASCIFTLFSSTKSLYMRATPSNTEFGASIMYVCIFLTLIVVLYQSYVFKKTQSKIVAADKLHYFSDFLTNIVVISSLYLSATFWYIDGIMGIVISLYIMKGSFSLFREAIRNLADEEFIDEDRDKIIAVVKNYSDVKGMHDLKTRSAGNKPFIQFHLELNGEFSLKKAHTISDEISEEILKLFPNAEIIIHQDPV